MKVVESTAMGLLDENQVCCICPQCVDVVCYKRAYRDLYKQQRYQGTYGGYRTQKHKKRSGKDGLWRPWVEEEEEHQLTNTISSPPNFYPDEFSYLGKAVQKPPQFQHPVKLVWPKKPYDYMYAEGERLLRDFPVQATLDFVVESDSEEDDDDDEYYYCEDSPPTPDQVSEKPRRREEISAV